MYDILQQLAQSNKYTSTSMWLLPISICILVQVNLLTNSFTADILSVAWFLGAQGRCRVESCKPWGPLPIHLFRHCCCKMYRLATMHKVTDRRTDRRQYHAHSWSSTKTFNLRTSER